jgi:hypothetical protein
MVRPMLDLLVQNWGLAMISKEMVRIGILIILLIVGCGDNIIQRASKDYFQYREGNWWRLASDQDTITVEIETIDTLLQIECYPVSYGGYVKYLVKNPDAILEYAIAVYHFSGEDHTIFEDFIERIELPLINGNTWQDSLVDSIFVAGAWVKAKYYSQGLVTGFENVSGYGDVYTVEINSIEMIISPDTMYIDTVDIIESYAPEIGLVHLENNNGIFDLIDYEVE